MANMYKYKVDDEIQLVSIPAIANVPEQSVVGCSVSAI